MICDVHATGRLAPMEAARIERQVLSPHSSPLEHDSGRLNRK
jgi:hypothetical protein